MLDASKRTAIKVFREMTNERCHRYRKCKWFYKPWTQWEIWKYLFWNDLLKFGGSTLSPILVRTTELRLKSGCWQSHTLSEGELRNVYSRLVTSDGVQISHYFVSEMTETLTVWI